MNQIDVCYTANVNLNHIFDEEVAVVYDSTRSEIFNDKNVTFEVRENFDDSILDY
jgi:hypothetical protein